MKAILGIVTTALLVMPVAAEQDRPTLPDREFVSEHHYREGAAKRASMNASDRSDAFMAKSWAPEITPLEYDVKEYELDLFFDLDRHMLSGTVTMDFEALQDGLTEITVDAGSNMRILGVHLLEDERYPHDSGQDLAFVHQNDRLLVEMPRQIDDGERMSLAISFGSGGQGLAGRGMSWSRLPDGTPLVSSLSQALAARNWWPCQDRPDDKALVTVRVTAPADLTAASNGLQVERTVNSDGTATTVFASRYPISTYLVVVNISDYTVFEVEYESLDQTTTMPVEIYTFDSVLDESRDFFANTPRIIEVFAERFGEYPFLDEKYGNCLTPFGGGMEHQTLCSYGANLIGATWLDAHETAHQWWGDHVTYDSWQEIWLAEGLASYSEWLWLEATDPDEMMPYAIGSDNLGFFFGPLYDNEEFFSVTVYDKAAWVYHMMRWVVGDEAFFSGLRSYADEASMDVASTADLLAAMEEASGQDLDWFFEQWVYGENRPHWQYSWEAGVDSATLTITQVHSNAEYFRMPVEVEMTTENGTERTVVWVEAEQEQTFEIAANGTPTELLVDPDHWLLCDLAPAEYPDVELGPDYPGPYDFGLALTGQTATGSIPLSNVGGATLEVDDIYSFNNPSFQILSPELPFSLEPGESVEIEIEGRPSSMSTSQAFFVIESNDPSRGGWTIFVTEITGAMAEEPRIMLNRDVDFGWVAVGALEERSFDLRNFGGQALVADFSVSGPGFVLGGSDSVTLGSQENHEVHLLFNPVEIGESTGALTITTNDPLNPEVVVDLHGIGTEAPRIEISPAIIAFGMVESGSEVTVEVSNSGDADLSVCQLEIQAPFEIVDPWSLPALLAPGESRTLTIRFTGSQEGEVRGTLRILSDDRSLQWSVVPLTARLTESAVSRMAFPAVARTSGIGGASWLSHAMLLNPGVDELPVDLVYRPGSVRDTAVVDRSLTIRAGEMRVLEDVVDSLGQSGAGGLVVEALDQGLIAMSRTFTQEGVGTYGQSIGAVDVADAQTGERAYLLAGLMGNDGYHTNIGMLNLAEIPINVDVVLYDGSGAQIGTLALEAEAGGFTQTNSVISKMTADRIRGAYGVARGSQLASTFLVYASVVDDGSHDPTFITPIPIVDEGAFDVLIPAAAAEEGLNGTEWLTQLHLVNLGETDAEVELSFHPRGGGQAATAEVEVLAGNTYLFEDVVGEAFSVQGSGWIGLTSEHGDLYVTSRTFNNDARGTYGQFIPAIALAELAGRGDVLVLAGANSTDGFRSNLGIASAAASLTSFEITAHAANGDVLGTVTHEVPAGAFAQFDRVLAEDFGFSGYAWVSLTTDDSGAAYVAYVSVVDAETGDPVFIPAMRVQ